METAGPRPRHVADVLVGAVVGEGPQAAARFPIEAMDPFRRLRLGLQIGDVHAAFGHGRAAVAAADGGAPADGKLGGGELFDNAGFLPHAVASRTAPLRPIVAHELTTACRQTDHHAEQQNYAIQFVHTSGIPKGHFQGIASVLTPWERSIEGLLHPVQPSRWPHSTISHFNGERVLGGLSGADSSERGGRRLSLGSLRAFAAPLAALAGGAAVGPGRALRATAAFLGP